MQELVKDLAGLCQRKAIRRAEAIRTEARPDAKNVSIIGGVSVFTVLNQFLAREGLRKTEPKQL